MTVRQALDEKRKQLAGNVASLVICKGELFYYLKVGKMGNRAEDSVYPVSAKTVEAEAAFFGCEWSEQ